MNKQDLDTISAISRRNASRLLKRKENKVTTKNGKTVKRQSPIDDVTELLAILDKIRIREAARNLPKGA
jgi:hypothetical protein